MNGFMYKVARFFQGRYGIDKLFYGICGVAVVLSAANLFVRFIAGFENDNAERTEKLLEKYPHVKVIRFNSRRQAEKFLKGSQEYYDKKL